MYRSFIPIPLDNCTFDQHMINFSMSLKALLSGKRSLYRKYQMHHVPANPCSTHKTLEAMKYIFRTRNTVYHITWFIIGEMIWVSERTLKLVHKCTLTWDVTEADIRMMKKTTVEETVGTWEATLGEAAAAAAARYQATVLQQKKENGLRKS